MSPSPSIAVSPELEQQMFEGELDSCRRVAGMSEAQTRELVRSMLDGGDGPYRQLESFLPKFEAPRILEVGSGYGLGLCGMLGRGLDVVGIEPGKDPFEGRYELARQLLIDNGFDPQRLHAGVAEALPFSDESFDIVHSTAVVEHVQNPSKAMNEMARVLKPGGLLFTHVPNYHSFYEGHYRVLWVPWLLRSKRLAKLYVEHVHHRDPAFVDTLNFVTPAWFRRWASLRGESVHTYPVLPVLAKLNRSISLVAHDLEPEPSLPSWLQTRTPTARTVVAAGASALCNALMQAGLAKEIVVLYWKDQLRE